MSQLYSWTIGFRLQKKCPSKINLLYFITTVTEIIKWTGYFLFNSFIHPSNKYRLKFGIYKVAKPFTTGLYSPLLRWLIVSVTVIKNDLLVQMHSSPYHLYDIHVENHLPSFFIYLVNSNALCTTCSGILLIYFRMCIKHLHYPRLYDRVHGWNVRFMPLITNDPVTVAT